MKFEPVNCSEINKLYYDGISRVVFNHYVEELGYAVVTVNSVPPYARVEGLSH